ncbi:MAG: hypothetical protein KW788_03380 [Candidatus Doudnabacteria bacterium]|nr:hypothetical protein [Candidatus Doudnabacteria bacterium]
MIDLEQIIDEVSNRLQRGRDISFWQNNYQLSPIVNLLAKLSLFPKAPTPTANFVRIKNQIMDRISEPSQASEPAKISHGFSYFFKFTTGAVGTLLIIISLGVGTAVAALQSVPGQTIYPLKRIVENTELKLTRDPETRANLQIQFANNRLEELATVLERNRTGEISSDETQKIVSQTIADLEKTTAAALNSSTTGKTNPTSKQVSTLNKLVTLSNKQTAILKPLLSAASITNDGQVKIVLEQALETSKISKEEAIRNIENAGLKVEAQPITFADDSINKASASGNITALTSDTISIGTSKFLMTKDTKYDNIKTTELKVGLAVKITGEVREDNKTYAQVISPTEAPQAETKPTTSTTETESAASTTDQP